MKKNLILVSGVVGVVLFSSLAYAERDPEWVTHTILPVASFHNYLDITAENSIIPKVIKVTSAEPEFRIDKGYIIVASDVPSTPVPTGVQIEAVASRVEVYSREYPEITDGKFDTFASLPFTAPEQTNVLHLTSRVPITSSRLEINLDGYVSSPDRVSLSAVVDGKNTIIVADKSLSDLYFNFPKTRASDWTLTFKERQPLRISEVKIVQSDVTDVTTRSIFFLAQPNVSYRIYFNPEGYISTPYDLSIVSSKPSEEKYLTQNNIHTNPLFSPADSDHDGVPDTADNCPNISNSDQSDIDSNGKGDVCSDNDYDSIINSQDNCPNIPNADQQDTDGDHIGDVCDSSENRFTEKYPWLPWVGIGSAALVLVLLFAVTAKGIVKKEENKTEGGGDN